MQRERDATSRQYGILKDYLASFIAQGLANGRISAKDKLNRLPPDQFFDVSTDLTDEIERRLKNDRDARQKMATLPVTRFKELAYAVFMEIERRFPDVVQDFKRDSYNDTLDSRNGGTDRRVSDRRVSDRNSENNSRRDRSSSIKARERRAPSQTRTSDSRKQEEYSNVRSDYEFKIAMLEKQVRSLESAEDNMRRLQEDLEDKSQLVDELQVQITQLQEENRFLQEDYNDQQRDTEKIKKEAATLLEDVQKLTSQNKSLASRLEDAEDEKERLISVNEKQLDEIARLKSEIASLKSSTLANLDTSQPWNGKGQDLSPQSSPTFKSPDDPPQPDLNFNKGSGIKNVNGLTASSKRPVDDELDQKYSKYEDASKKLIEASNREPGSAVLQPMKTILLTCKEITEAAEKLEELPSTKKRDKDSIGETKDKLSDSLTELMAAAKMHASKGGGAIDIQEELKLLTIAVSDLLEIMRNIKANAPQSGAPLTSDTIKDRASGNFSNPPPMNVEDLQYYIEDQTDDIAHTIQDLLQAMRQNDAPGSELADLINDLMNFVDNIIYETRATLDITNDLGKDVRADIDDVLELLEDDREKMLDMADQIVKTNDKAIKQQIANSSYEVAKVFKFDISMQKSCYPSLILEYIFNNDFSPLSMFVLSQIQDIVRIPPKDFANDPIPTITNHINLKYSNKVLHNVGVCIQLYDIQSTTDFVVHQCQDGSYQANVSFRMIVFRPFIGQVITGKVKKSSFTDGLQVSLEFFDDIYIPPQFMLQGSQFNHEENVWVWVYEGNEMFMDYGEPIRFRIEQEIFTDGPVKDENSVAPYKLIASIAEAGLGLLLWWE